MHKNTPGALISYKGHTLTADEFHAVAYGLIGLAAASDEVSRTIAKEPHYFLGSLALFIAIGRRLR